MIRRSVLGALSCAFITTVVVAAAPGAILQELDEVLVTARAKLPVEDLVEFPKYDSVAISPDGTRLAVTWVNEKFQRGVSILEFPSLKNLHGYQMPSGHNLAEVGWANNDRLIVQPDVTERSFLRIRRPIGAITTMDVDGGRPQFTNREALALGDALATYRGDEESIAALGLQMQSPPDPGKWPGRNSQGPVRLIRTQVGGDPNMALIQTTRAYSRSGEGEGYGAFQLNVRDAKQTRVATLPVSGGQFVLGPNAGIALATGINARNERVTYYLPPDERTDGRAWQLVSSGQSGERGLWPVAWTGNGEEYYALDGRSAATVAVVAWNPKDNTQRVLQRNADADLDQVAIDPNGKAWMFYGNGHFPVYWYPDANHPLARLHRLVRQRARDELVDIVSVSDDMGVAVVRVSSGRRAPIYFPVYVSNGNSITGLFTYPTLRGTRLSRVEPIEFRARDGQVIRGYLTTPEDASGNARTGLPLVVIAHDGPVGEAVTYGYEYERQLIASRGYAVLQINRRGTPGRGQAFERAGDGKWGQETQDDYIDGARWAVRDGVADGERICFYGTGYGAYSGMVAAARAPEVFKCVVGVAGAYDLPLLLGNGEKPVPPALTKVLGSDMTVVANRSPVSLASAIKASVMLIPQEKDEHFQPDQTNRMRTALKDAGNTAQFQMIGQELNGQHTQVTRANAYDVIFKFLEKQIGN